MVKRLFAVAFIFCCTSAAWMILGGTIMSRTGSTADRLRDHVQSIWGAPHVQTAPSAEYDVPVDYVETTTENGVQKTVAKTRLDTYVVRPDSSNIAVDLQAENRRKGLLWYATYKVVFQGDYAFTNRLNRKQTLRLVLPLPAAQAVYDDLHFMVDGKPFTPLTEKETAHVSIDTEPGQTVRLQVAYRSD